MSNKLPTWGDWSCYRSRAFARALAFKVNGVATDISGYTITFRAKADYADADADSLITRAATITVAASGLALLSLTATDTDLAPGSYCGVLVIQPATGAAIEIRGRFSIA